MTAGFARWCTEGAVVAALLALPGCGSTDEARQSTLWEQSDPLVKVVAPDPVVLPGDPGPGISITRLTLPTATERAAMEPGLSAQTLYADPEAAELLAGRALLVGRTTEGDTEGAFPIQGEAITIHGQNGRIEQRGPLWIVVWSLRLIQDCACDRQAVVAGRNLAREQVVAAANAADANSGFPTIAKAALPDGLRSLGTLPALGRGDRWHTINEMMTFLVGPSTVEVRVVDGDPRLAAHLGFWTDGWRTFEYSGTDMATTRWVRGHALILDHRGGPPIEPSRLDGLVGALRDASRADVEAKRAALMSRPPDEGDRCDELGGDPTRASIFAGTVDGARWTLTIGGDDKRISTCEQIDTGRGTPIRGAGSNGFTSGTADEIRLVAGGSFGTGDGRTFSIVAGDVAAEVAEVIITVGDRASLHAQIGATGPIPNRHWFATAALGDPRDVTTAVALDASGKEIGRTRSPSG